MCVWLRFFFLCVLCFCFSSFWVWLFSRKQNGFVNLGCFVNGFTRKCMKIMLELQSHVLCTRMLSWDKGLESKTKRWCFNFNIWVYFLFTFEGFCRLRFFCLFVLKRENRSSILLIFFYFEKRGNALLVSYVAPTPLTKGVSGVWHWSCVINHI